MNVYRKKTFKAPGYTLHHRNLPLEDNAKTRAAEAMRRGEKEFKYEGVQYVRYNGGFVEWCCATNPRLIGR